MRDNRPHHTQTYRETLMEFSTQTTASLHQIKTAALAVGVFATAC